MAETEETRVEWPSYFSLQLLWTSAECVGGGGICGIVRKKSGLSVTA